MNQIHADRRLDNMEYGGDNLWFLNDWSGVDSWSDWARKFNSSLESAEKLRTKQSFVNRNDAVSANKEWQSIFSAKSQKNTNVDNVKDMS